jgi:fructokinase
MTNERRGIIGIGEVLWDLLPGGAVCGGAPANFACHAAALGGAAAVVSCVGADPLGERAVATIAARGVDCHHMRRDGHHPTGTVDVAIDAGGEATYTFAADTAWDHLEWSDALGPLAAGAAAVCFGTLGQRSPVSRSTIRRFVAATPRHALRVFDVNLRQQFHSPDLIRESLALASVLKLNEDELPVVAAACGIDHADPVATLCGLSSRHGLRLAALTCGAAGSVLVSGDEVSRRAAEPAVVVDTVGAGDAFTAAVVEGLLAGRGLETIHERASRLAAFVCSQPGAMPPPVASAVDTSGDPRP